MDNFDFSRGVQAIPSHARCVAGRRAGGIQKAGRHQRQCFALQECAILESKNEVPQAAGKEIGADLAFERISAISVGLMPRSTARS
jgi:hypothetical protein